MSTFEINKKLAELFNLPPDTMSATLRIRANSVAMLTITRAIVRDEQMVRTTTRFRLVPEESTSGETVKGEVK